MPELPEVETIRLDLKKELKGRRIVRVRIFTDPRGVRMLRRYPSRKDFVRRLRGRKIKGIDRRGKYLLFGLDNGEVLILHLGMSGQLLYRCKGVVADRFTRAVFHLENGRELRFCDARKFGEAYLFSSGRGDTVVNVDVLGREPLSSEFDVDALGRCVENRKKPIKALLLDQKIIAGIGNIYSDEILFASGIHPETPANKLPDEKIRKLHRAIKAVLGKAVKYRGTSAADEKYVDGFGDKGNFQKKLKVYQRKGKRCFRCRTPIKAIRFQGRTSYYCPKCQKKR